MPLQINSPKQLLKTVDNNLSNKFMLEALNQARIASQENEVPIGCVIVENGNIISLAHNKNLCNLDPTAHSEIIAIRKACEIKQQKNLQNCDIYITLEPCPMCLMAISYARIRRIYYGANDEKFGAIESNPLFVEGGLKVFRGEVYSGINAKDSIKLLKEFFQNKR